MASDSSAVHTRTAVSTVGHCNTEATHKQHQHQKRAAQTEWSIGQGGSRHTQISILHYLMSAVITG